MLGLKVNHVSKRGHRCQNTTKYTPLYQHGLTSVPAWKNNYAHYIMQHEITCVPWLWKLMVSYYSIDILQLTHCCYPGVMLLKLLIKNTITTFSLDKWVISLPWLHLNIWSDIKVVHHVYAEEVRTILQNHYTGTLKSHCSSWNFIRA